MKNVIAFVFLVCGSVMYSQSNINELFAAGIEDTEKFSNSYFSPVSEAAIYGLSNGWYNSAQTKPLGGFEISLIGNMTSFKNKRDKMEFNLNTAEYENLKFQDGSTSKFVSTALGDIEGIGVYVEGEVALGVTTREEFDLPTGIASEGINFIPTAFLQLSFGLVKGMEIKARFLPKIDTEEVALGLYGAGLQYDFTSLLPADEVFPVAISGVVGFTHLDAAYDFTNSSIVDGESQRVEIDMNVWSFQAVASTRLKIINFYGGLGYISGKSNTDVLGTYTVRKGPFRQTYVDPFSMKKDAAGMNATIGAKLKLGFFRLNVDYAIADFNNLTVGVNFGFR